MIFEERRLRLRLRSGSRSSSSSSFGSSSAASLVIIISTLSIANSSSRSDAAFVNLVNHNAAGRYQQQLTTAPPRPCGATSISRQSGGMATWSSSSLWWLCGDSSPFHYNDSSLVNDNNDEKEEDGGGEASASIEVATVTPDDPAFVDDGGGGGHDGYVEDAVSASSMSEEEEEGSACDDVGRINPEEQDDDVRHHATTSNIAIDDGETNAQEEAEGTYVVAMLEGDDDDDNKRRRPSLLRRSASKALWARAKVLRHRRRSRLVNRKLSRAHDRFEKRRSSIMGGGGSADIRGSASSSSMTSITDDELSQDDATEDRDDGTGRDFDGMESAACYDQMPFAHGEIKKMPYVHGGFFGAAPFMLANPRWTAILRKLMPDVYVEMSRRAAKSPAERLIHWAENNPVMAAYGTAHEMEYSGEMPVLEWDVFLDPRLVKRLERALDEKEAFVREEKVRRLEAELGEERREEEGDSSETVMNTNSANGSEVDDDEVAKIVLSNYDDEIEKRTAKLVEGMLIAHGNVRQIIAEQTGLFKKLNFASVRRTCKTLGGGMFARQWLAVYSEAMKLGTGYDDDYKEEDSEATKLGMSYDGYDDACEEVAVSEMDIDSGTDASIGDQKEDDDSYNFPKIDFEDERIDHRGLPGSIRLDDWASTDGDSSLDSEPSLEHSQRISAFQRKHLDGWTTPTPALERVDAVTLHEAAAYDNQSISRSVSSLSAPCRLILDLKSRHVSRRVWALAIDHLRDAGVSVEGIASFNVSEMRGIGSHCDNGPVDEIFFLHSAGDMQHMCHTGQIRRGDRVFFNAGSLFWDYRNADVVKSMLRRGSQPCFGRRDGGGDDIGYRLKPHARVTKPGASHEDRMHSEEERGSSNDDRDSNGNLFAGLFGRSSLPEMDFSYEEAPDGGSCSTIQQYKEHYDLSIGLYVQECAIDEATLNLIVKYVNSNLHVYDLGLSWGGINGLTVKGIAPSRFAVTDGMNSQRFVSVPWKRNLHPDSAKRLPRLGFLKKVLFH